MEKIAPKLHQNCKIFPGSMPPDPPPPLAFAASTPTPPPNWVTSVAPHPEFNPGSATVNSENMAQCIWNYIHWEDRPISIYLLIRFGPWLINYYWQINRPIIIYRLFLERCGQTAGAWPVNRRLLKTDCRRTLERAKTVLDTYRPITWPKYFSNVNRAQI